MLKEETKSNRRTEKIELLQSGRGIAAVLVVLHHANQSVTDFIGNESAIARSAFHFGYLGVDFFFVLSGFIIFYATQRQIDEGNFEFGSYVWKRFARVFLPYWPIGILYALLYTFLPSVSQGARDWSWFASLTLFPTNSETALSVAWTLRHELIFYLIFGVLATFQQRLVGFATWGAIIIATAFFLPSTFRTQVVLQLFGLINLEFLFGLLIGYFVFAKKQCRWSYCLILMATSWALWIYLGSERSDSWLVGLGLAPLLWVLIDLEASGKLRQPRWLVFLGDASYSIYLAHLIAISVGVRLLQGRVFNEWFSLLLLSSLGVVGGIVYYLLIERPVLSLSKPRKRKPDTI